MQEIEKEIKSVLETAEKIKQIENKPQFCISKCNLNKANQQRFATIKKNCDINPDDLVIIIKIDNAFSDVYRLLKALNQVNSEQRVIEKLLEPDSEFDYIDGELITTNEQHREWMRRNNTIPIIKKEKQ